MNEPRDVATTMLTVDSTRGSPFHALVRYGGSGDGRAMLRLGALVGAGMVLTYGLMFAAAVGGHVPLWQFSAGVQLPFLRDWNTAFMFLVSFPVLILLTLTDDAVLNRALSRVQDDGVLSIGHHDAEELRNRWTQRYRRVNAIGLWVSCGVGVLIGWGNLVTYSPRVGFWISLVGRGVVPAGWCFLFSVGAFYAVVSFYALRSLATVGFMYELVQKADLRLLPAHPDRCGGLRPMGEIGLRNQYALSVLGLNVILLVAVAVHYYVEVPPALYVLMALAGLAYIVLGPAAFLGPLLPFRSAMLEAKTVILGEVAKRLGIELTRIRNTLEDDALTKDDEALLERLRNLGGIVDELPVWPFDVRTLRRFVSAYIVPLVAAVGYPLLLKAVTGLFGATP